MLVVDEPEFDPTFLQASGNVKRLLPLPVRVRQVPLGRARDMQGLLTKAATWRCVLRVLLLVGRA